MNQTTYQTLLDRIQEIEIIDTHEHILSREDVRKDPLHLFRLFENSYARLDFTSAGMPVDAWQERQPDSIWQHWKKYQDHVILNCFYQNIIRALQDLYGFEGSRITKADWPELSEKVVDAYDREDWYEFVLKQKAGFKVSLLDTFWSVEAFRFDPAIFTPVLRTNPFILGRQFESRFPKGLKAPTSVETIAEEWDISLKEFESYLVLIDTAIEKYRETGSPAVKIATAYERTLQFERVSKNEAARLYQKAPCDLTFSERKALQDYMAHYVIQQAASQGLPVQIHTGILARNANIIGNSNPEHLNELFLMYPDTRFVLLHFSFPYMQQAFSLAKMFPNVYLDFCWVPMLSKRAAVTALDEFFDLVPNNKLMWGGDAFRVEEAYAAACAAREVMAMVMAGRVDCGDLDLEAAEQLCRSVFYGNAKEFFGI